MSVAVLGSGSWGTAFAMVMADAGQDVTLWARREEVAATINDTRRNADYLPDTELPDNLRATSDVGEALDSAEIVVLAVPSQSLRDNLGDWGGHIPQESAVVSLMKGIELGTSKRMSEVITDAGDIDPARVVVVSGPNLAKEIAARRTSGQDQD